MIVCYGNCEFKDINFVPRGTYLVKERRVLEVIKMIKKENEPALYTNKREVVKVLEEAVKNGDNAATQTEHVDNIKNMLGKHRIFE